MSSPARCNGSIPAMLILNSSRQVLSIDSNSRRRLGAREIADGRWESGHREVVLQPDGPSLRVDQVVARVQPAHLTEEDLAALGFQRFPQRALESHRRMPGRCEAWAAPGMAGSSAPPRRVRSHLATGARRSGASARPWPCQSGERRIPWSARYEPYFERRCRGIQSTDIAGLEHEVPASRAYEQTLRTARQARERDRSGAVVLGCAGMADLCNALQKDLGVPVIRGVEAAHKLAEALVALGLGTSKLGEYAPSLPKRYTGLAEPYSP